MHTAAARKAQENLRPHEIHYHAWSPPDSSIEIEYSNQLLREVQLTSMLGDSQGVLFGKRHGDRLRVVAARRTLKPAVFESDPRLDGLDPVGVFFARIRGQVFLTESDLEQFEKSGATVALVVAGTKAGFFVYEADGSIETIKSREEFWVPDVTALTKPVDPPKFLLWKFLPQTFLTEIPPANSWTWVLATVSIAMLLMAQSSWRPLPPISLAVHEQGGQLHISWSRAAIAGGATLEIADGASHMSMPISAALASTTYVRRTASVQVHLTAAGRRESVRFFGSEMVSRIEISHQQLTDLESEARALDETLERGGRRINRLQAAINKLLHAPQ